MRIRQLQSFSKYCEGPDWRFLNHYAKGVRIGWHAKMPRAPAVYERKVKWSLGPEVPDPADHRLTQEPNHKSLRDHVELCP